MLDVFSSLSLCNDPCVLLPPKEPDQHDVREDVASTETLLQTEHHQEGAWTKTAIQVGSLQVAFLNRVAHTIHDISVTEV